MRIVMLSWRDQDNPEAGGAERFLHRVAAGLVERGHQVTVATAAYEGAAPVDVVDGVRIVRRGGKLTVYPRATAALLRGALGRADVVVDVQNGVPFFSRVARTAPVVVLVHHVHREQWPVVYGPRRAAIGWWVESRVAPAVYRRSRYITVSEHSRDELTQLGIGGGRISIVHNGTDRPPQPPWPRSPTPRLVTLGRLVPHKRVEHALRVVAALRDSLPDVHLDVVGDGWWADHLLALRRDLLLDDAVTFHGYVEEAAKHQLLDSAWVHLAPSLKEGWGLAVLEAAAHGVPTVGYAAAGGLADSVVDGVTGVLVDDEASLGTQARALLTDTERCRRLGSAAAARARTFTWDHTVAAFEKVLLEVIGR